MTAGGSATSLEDFKARLPLAEIVARYVRLQRRGREHSGLCPFHQEKTPSFTVSDAKGFYHCFGCGQHGNAIDFIMAIEGLEFGDALTRLSDLTGIAAPKRAGEGAPAVDRSLLAANDAAARWFSGRLASGEGTEARAYLERRGVGHEWVERFGLGYAPTDRTALKRALIAEGYAEEQLVASGLLVHPEDGGSSFARFRHRLMFPIQDPRGRVVGFGGRALGEARAKYLNTPETALFRKGELLYGLPLARQAARSQGTVVVAEGYMDVIALARAGFGHAVAPLGTAITETQLTLLWRLADEPVVCLDGDEAGLRAAHRLIERALPLLQPGRSLRLALLPPGEDPDSLLRHAGREALTRHLDAALPLIDFLWQRELAGRNLSTPERRAALKQRFRILADSIVDRDLRWLFIQEMRQRFEKRFEPGRAPRKGATAAAAGGGLRTGVGRLAQWVSQPDGRFERELLGAVLVHPELLAEVEEELAGLEFTDPEVEVMRERIIAWYCEHGSLDPQELSDHLTGIGFAGLVEQLSADGPSGWYRRAGTSVGQVREGWHARVAQHRRRMERRALREAVAEAIVAQREREVNAHRLAVDRLINRGDETATELKADDG